jgi:hypothetical protein
MNESVAFRHIPYLFPWLCAGNHPSVVPDALYNAMRSLRTVILHNPRGLLRVAGLWGGLCVGWQSHAASFVTSDDFWDGDLKMLHGWPCV